MDDGDKDATPKRGRSPGSKKGGGTRKKDNDETAGKEERRRITRNAQKESSKTSESRNSRHLSTRSQSKFVLSYPKVHTPDV